MENNNTIKREGGVWLELMSKYTRQKASKLYGQPKQQGLDT